MEPKVRAALEASIKHWEENLAAEEPYLVELGPAACALCQLFRKRIWRDTISCEDDNLGRCPVYKKTGEKGCEGSPYDGAVEAFGSWEFLETPFRRKMWQEAAQAELDFLKSLRED